MNAFCIGFLVRYSAIPPLVRSVHCMIKLLINSLPLSLTIIFGLPRASMIRSAHGQPAAQKGRIGDESQAIPCAVIHDRQNPELAAISDLFRHEASDQRSLAASGSTSARVPIARLRLPRLRTVSFCYRWRRNNFLWLTRWPVSPRLRLSCDDSLLTASPNGNTRSSRMAKHPTEVITSVGRGRRRSREYKARLVTACVEPDGVIS